MAVKIERHGYTHRYSVPLAEAPLIEVTGWGRRRLRYRLTEIIIVHLESGHDYPSLYGIRVRVSDGMSFGRVVPVPGNYRAVTSL